MLGFLPHDLLFSCSQKINFANTYAVPSLRVWQLLHPYEHPNGRACTCFPFGREHFLKTKMLPFSCRPISALHDASGKRVGRRGSLTLSARCSRTSSIRSIRLRVRFSSQLAADCLSDWQSDMENTVLRENVMWVGSPLYVVS